MTRIACYADLHGNLPHVPECDVLIIAGDICPVRDHSLPRQGAWLRKDFASWLLTARHSAREIIGVAGNHDFIAEADPDLMHSLPWTYLQDESVEVDELLFHGTPWSLTYGPWAFMGSEHELEQRWRLFPEDLDVLITHGPPRLRGDLTLDGVNAGSQTLAFAIEAAAPGLVVTGHIHEARGVYVTQGGSTIVNASRMDVRYNPINEPIIVEYM